MNLSRPFIGRSKKIYLGFGVVVLALICTGILLRPSVRAVDNTYYIDCSAPVNGTGTIGSPWNTPLSLFEHQVPPTPYTFGAGDRVLIRSGTTCTYPIRMVRGSGTQASPVIISTYDTGARPIINGSNVEVDNWEGPGIGDSAAVQLRDFDNVTIEGLELTNTGGGNLEGRRMGIWSLATEVYGARRNITIRDNYIHDILGEYKKNAEATAGINIEQRLPPTAVDPNPTATWYENITIEGNVIERTNRQGISFWGDWRNRPEDGYNPTGPAWTGWTGVRIANNTINNVRGDAILVTNTDGAIVENNTVNGFNELNGLTDPEILAIRQDAQTKQGLPTLPSRNHAGIWTYNADDTLIQYNDVRGGVSNRDGMAYDIDGASVGTVIQYNYSQDNEGGFVLICGELGQIRDGIVRYNISKDDGHASITTCVGEVLNTKIYNNTIFSTDPTLIYPYYQVDWERFPGDPMNDTRDISIENNIFRYPNRNIPYFFYNFRDNTGLTPDQVNSNTTASTNIYSSVAAPSIDAEAITGTPLFLDTSDTASGFELYASSIGVDDGKTILNNGGIDYFGQTLAAPFNIGALETSAPDVIIPTGDNNGDGIDDSLQSNVRSFINPLTNKIVTVQILDDGQVSGTPTDCTSIDSLTNTEATTVQQDSRYTYPVGMIDFEVTCSTPGDTTSVTILLDAVYDTSAWELRKYTTVFSQVQGAVYGTKSVNGNNVTTITYQLTDGGPLDADGVVDGSIDDPIGPAQIANVPGVPNTGIAMLKSPVLWILLLSFSAIAAYTKLALGKK